MTLDLSLPPSASPVRYAGRPTVRHLRHVLGLTLGSAALVVAVPLVAGVPWAGIAATVGSVPTAYLVGLVLLWLAGLVAHTVTLTSALPGLSHRRALMLSLTGSSVSNVLPAGGAAGIALNYRMTRAWGFARPDFATYTLLTNLWDVLAKLALPAVLVPLVLVVGGWQASALIGVAGVAVGSAVVLGAAAVVLSRPAALVRAVATVNALVRTARRLARQPPGDGLTVEQVGDWRDDTRALAQARWQPLSGGMMLYSSLLLALLLACLHVTGAAVPLGAVALAFCAERLMTVLPLTPGGLGVVEVGLVGLLTLAPGSSAAGIASGVLLYRALTFGLEIPVGGALLGGWLWRRRRG